MQRGGSTPTASSNANAFFSSAFFGGSSNKESRSRPGTSSGDAQSLSLSQSQSQSQSLSQFQLQLQQFQPQQPQPQPPLAQPNVLTKDRRPSFGRKSSFSSTSASPSKSSKRRANSSSSSTSLSGQAFTDSSRPPALPDFALAAAAKISRDVDVFVPSPASGDSFPLGVMSRMPGGGGRSAAAPMSMNGSQGQGQNQRPPSSRGGDGTSGFGGGIGGMNGGVNGVPPVPSLAGNGLTVPTGVEGSVVHQQIVDLATKRISTLDYLRKAHEGHVYWFNTLLFEKPDLQRMPYFSNPAKLARRATNYLLLGLSLPAVTDLNSASAHDFLRSLYVLMQEFESFQQLHGEGGNAGSLTRARLPQVFRRTAFGKSRRAAAAGGSGGGGLGGGDITNPMERDGSMAGFGGLGLAAGPANASVMSFAGGDSDLLPGEEYLYLLTPSLPFEPDFFETFATLCDVLIDVYTRLLSLLPTPRDVSAPVAELFAKCDAKIRKIIVSGVVKEFEDQSRQQAKQELAGIGRVVLGGLM